MASLFASGRKAHVTTLLITSYSLLNPGHFRLKLYFEKSQSLALFLSFLPPTCMKPLLSSKWPQPWHTPVEGSVGCWSIFLHCVSKTMSYPQSNWPHSTPLFHAKLESHQHNPGTCRFPPSFSVARVTICLAHQYLLLLNTSDLTRMTRSHEKRGRGREREGNGIYQILVKVMGFWFCKCATAGVAWFCVLNAVDWQIFLNNWFVQRSWIKKWTYL